jgi:hypothetical protein
MENNYKKNGVSVYENFISKDKILKLREECFHLFSYSQILGHHFSVRLNKFVKELPYPTVKVNSVNLLEIAIDINDELKMLGYDKMKLANVALYNEKNNPNELIWHSDLRNGGLIRAQIVIDGGGINSGAFKYLVGSHKLKIDNPYPSKELLKSEEQNILICDKTNGSLFLIDTLGYHSKCVCIEPRTSLMFDFLPEEYIIENPNDVSSEIHINSSSLTLKVMENIDLFKNGVLRGTKSPNTADSYKFYKPFAGSSFKEILYTLKKIMLKKISK